MSSYLLLECSSHNMIFSLIKWLSPYPWKVFFPILFTKYCVFFFCKFLLYFAFLIEKKKFIFLFISFFSIINKREQKLKKEIIIINNLQLHFELHLRKSKQQYRLPINCNASASAATITEITATTTRFLIYYCLQLTLTLSFSLSLSGNIINMYNDYTFIYFLQQQQRQSHHHHHHQHQHNHYHHRHQHQLYHHDLLSSINKCFIYL